MADEQNIILSDATEGEVNGLSVTNVRSVVAMLSKMASTLMKSGLVRPEEVASAFASVSAHVAAVAYTDIEIARKLLHGSFDLLPGVYAELAKDEAGRAKPMFIFPDPSTLQ